MTNTSCSLQLHPEASDEHLDAMEGIGGAYEVLTDPIKREAYDQRRHSDGRATLMKVVRPYRPVPLLLRRPG